MNLPNSLRLSLILVFGSLAIGHAQEIPKPPPAGNQIIEGIEFHGLRRVPQDVMRLVIHTKAGDVFDEESVRKDFKDLRDTKRFDDIQVKIAPGERGGMVLVFTVKEVRVR